MPLIYKNLNNIQTQLLTVDDPFDCNGSDVIVCVTGNPGVPDFYTEFAEELHKSIGLPICVIGQAGHVEVPDVQSNTLYKREHLYDLTGQLAHKIDLLQNHIDKRSKLHLIGHSVGAWMLLEILNHNLSISSRVVSINLMFPTLQRMAETNNGKFMNRFMRKSVVHFISIFVITLLCLFPKFIRLFLVGLWLKYESLPSHFGERILKFLNPSVLEQVLFLAHDEMDHVKELNTSAVEKVKHLTNIIYSNNDGWVPEEYMEALKPFQPPLKMKKVDISHTFVLKSGKRVAEMVSDFIKSKW